MTHRRKPGRRPSHVRLALMLMLPLALAGCSRFFPSDPGTSGYTGVGVDQAGMPLAYIAMCSGSVDVLQLGDIGGDDGGKPVAKLETELPVSTMAEVPLAKPGNAWSTKTPLGLLAEGTTYRVGAHDHDWNSSTEGVEFTVATLRRLSPGQVQWTKYDGERDTYQDLTSEADDFRKSACEL